MAAVLPPDPVFTLRAIDLTPIHSICFNCTGNSQQLLAGTQNGNVLIWDLATNRVCHKMSIGKSSILNICHSSDKFFTQEKAGMFKIWNKTESDYVVESTIESDYCGFCRFYISYDDNILICPEKNSNINVYTANGEKITTLSVSCEHNVGEIMCFKYLNFFGNQCILAAYESGDLFIWDLKLQKVVSNLKLREFPLALDYDTVSGRGVYGNASENIQVFSISKNDMKISLKCEIVMKNAGVNSLKIRHDKKVFVSGCWDGRLRVYSWKSLRPLAVLTEHTASIHDVCYSKEQISLWNAPIMAAGGTDPGITLWDIYN